MADIFSKIKEIRNKPEKAKKRILWIMVFICMVIVFGIWIFTFTRPKGESDSPVDLNVGNYPNYGKLEKSLENMEKEKNAAVKNVEFELEKVKIAEIAQKYIEESDSTIGGRFENLKLERIEKGNDNWYLNYKQYYKNIPVDKSDINLTVSAGRVATIASINYYNDIDIDIKPEVEKEAAYEIARSKIKIDSLQLKSSQLMVYTDIGSGKHYLAWGLVVFSEKPSYEYKYIINAKSGDIIDNYNLSIE